MPIRFIGLANFDTEEDTAIKQITREYYEKILRALEKSSIVLELKKTELSETNNKRFRYDFHVRVESANKIIATAESFDWDIKRTLHRVFQKLEHELQHKYKLEGHLPKH